MQGIPYEMGYGFCRLTNKPMVFFVVAVWVHLAVIVYNSKSTDEFLQNLFNLFSKKRFILSWIAIFITIPVLLIISLITRLCK
jgi:hypothetical protein